MSSIATQLQTGILRHSPVFSTGDAQRAASVSTAVISRALGAMADNKLIVRVRRGVWANPEHRDFSSYALIPFLVGEVTESRERPFVSFVSALHQHGCLSQIPGSIHIAVSRQRAPITTPMGRFIFHVLVPELMDGYVAGDPFETYWIATPEKALVDTLYLSTRRGKAFRHLPELEFDNRFSWRLVHKWVSRIPYLPLRVAVAQSVAALQENQRHEERRASGR